MPTTQEPTFGKGDLHTLKVSWDRVKRTIQREVSSQLQRRSTARYQQTDDRIFDSYIDSYALAYAWGTPFQSAYRELGREILDDVFNYEKQVTTKVNKEQMYFAMAINAYRSNDEINTLTFWELACRQHRRTYPNAKAQSLIEKLDLHFTSLVTSIEESHQNLKILIKLRGRYKSLLPSFRETLLSLEAVHQTEFLAAGIRNRKVILWLKHVNHLHIITVLAQELINLLCILVESHLKEKLCPGVEATFGSLLQRYVPPKLAAATPNIIATLFKQYPSTAKADFNASFLPLLKVVRRGILNGDSIKAHILYGAFMVRNKSLHQCDLSFSYLRRKATFEDTIGLLFAAVAVADSF